MTQPGEYMCRPVGLFHIMLTMDLSQRYKQAIKHRTLYKSQLACYLYMYVTVGNKLKYTVQTTIPALGCYTNLINNDYPDYMHK